MRRWSMPWLMYGVWYVGLRAKILRVSDSPVLGGEDPAWFGEDSRSFLRKAMG